MSQTHLPGHRLSFDGALCTVRYVGEVVGTAGTWLGVEWDDASRGKHDGCHRGVRYFSCRSSAPTAASFVRPTRPCDPPRSLVAAVRDKYADEGGDDARAGAEVVVISGKVAEEVGFDKVRRQLARLDELTVVIVDGARIAYATGPGEKTIRETCPHITELEISRNLFADFATVVEICEQLSEVWRLRLNGNRFRDVLDDSPALASASEVLCRIADLEVDETLLTWEEICRATSWFGSLASLSCNLNQLSSIPSAPPTSLANTLTTLNLDFNEFTSLSDLAPLSSLTSLRNLHLKGNNLSSILRDDETPVPVFSPSLKHLDISYNRIATWSFVDNLPDSFPGLSSLRLAHNPIYDNPTSTTSTTSSPQPHAEAPKQAASEDPFMITVARVACLQHLNFSPIVPGERTNAEMFYLSRIARQLAAVPEGSEAAVLAQHRRYAELCEVYGEPTVVRQQEISQSFLEGRLVTVHFHLDDDDQGQQVKRSEIPRSMDMYAVKGIAGRLFGLPPLGLRLVWETGEWDPVAGFDDEAAAAGESSGDEDDDDEKQQPSEKPGRPGRLVRRQVELADSPRQFGYCVDGSEAQIRVERR